MCYETDSISKNVMLNLFQHLLNYGDAEFILA